MNLRSFHTNICMFPDRVLSCQIALEGMTAFMSHNIHIPAGSIKVCENKRSLVVRKISHITAHCFGFSSEYIQKFIFHHKVKELFCLSGQFFIHFLSCCQNFFRCSFWLWISLWSENQLIRVRKLRKSQTLFSLLENALCKRNPDFFYLFSQVFNFFSSIAVSLHTQISQWSISIKAQLLGLHSTVFHQFIIQFVQFITDA